MRCCCLHRSPSLPLSLPLFSLPPFPLLLSCLSSFFPVCVSFFSIVFVFVCVFPSMPYFVCLVCPFCLFDCLSVCMPPPRPSPQRMHAHAVGPSRDQLMCLSLFFPSIFRLTLGLLVGNRFLLSSCAPFLPPFLIQCLSTYLCPEGGPAPDCPDRKSVV